MQDELPDLPASTRVASSTRGGPKLKLSIFADDKRLVKIILLAGFGLLVLLGIIVTILEQVAPRGGRPAKEDQAASEFWQLEPRPGQILFGFFEDKNKNNRFDYREQPFIQVSVAVRRKGETEPFRRVSAGTDGWVKIDDLAQGEYEVSFDNYAAPEPESPWQFFEEYQQNGEFLPTVWRPVGLGEAGHKELVGITAYQPALLLALASEPGLVWYDPERALVYGKSSFAADWFIIGKNVFYLQEGKLKKFAWDSRAVTEQLIWLEEAENSRWWLSPAGKTVAYLNNGQLSWRSRAEDCREGSLLFEGERPQVELAVFSGETSMLAAGERLFKVDCQQVEPVETTGKVESLGVLTGGAWFYSTADSTYLVWADKTVKYAALGGGGGISASADGRYLIKKLSANSWLIVDWPAVEASGVEKHYLLTGINGEPTVINDDVYFVKSKPCQADGDCGEVIKIRLESSGVWSVADSWDLKNVAATKVLGVVTN